MAEAKKKVQRRPRPREVLEHVAEHGTHPHPRIAGELHKDMMDRARTLYRSYARGVPNNDQALIDTRAALEREGHAVELDDVKTWREAYHWDIVVAQDDSKLFDTIRAVAEHNAKVRADPMMIQASVHHLADLAKDCVNKAAALIAAHKGTSLDDALAIADAAVRLSRAAVDCQAILEEKAPRIARARPADILEGEVLAPGATPEQHRLEGAFAAFSKNAKVTVKQ